MKIYKAPPPPPAPELETIVCDICGKELFWAPYNFGELHYVVKQFDGHRNEYDRATADLCPECLAKVVAFCNLKN